MGNSVTNKNKNISISGSGSAGGGNYDDIHISGSGTIYGNTTCEDFKCSGSAKIEGIFHVKHGKVSGSAKFLKDVTGDSFHVSGSTSIGGTLAVKEVETSGSIKIEKCLNAEHVDVSGSIKIGEDCNAETFELRGACYIDGLLNAGEVECKLHGHSRIKAIGAETISIEMGGRYNFLMRLIRKLVAKEILLTSSEIEGDDIDIEYTECKVVRGKNVKIGDKCKIDVVEYSDTVEISPKAKVENVVKC
ncbi:MAG: hypothetical protein ACI35O_03365 [Bacillaceae bacterium]